MVDVDPYGVRGLALTARTTALGYLGRADDAAIALDDLLLEPRSGPFTTAMLRAKAWSEVAAGRPAGARRTIGEAIALAASDGRAANELAATHDLLRITGDVPLTRIEGLAARVDGPYAPLVLAQARGLATEDAASLEDAARGHASMGAHLYAAECWAQAAGIHRRAGRKNDANDAAGLSRAAMARCEGPPATPPLLESEPLGSLTRREQEIVELAAGGLTDKEIAERLVVSARTVQTHLYNAYAKLGVEGREGLKGY
jgi:DNA-binding CsgD family transcriptional regulator